jgi:hypothetical protein
MARKQRYSSITHHDYEGNNEGPQTIETSQQWRALTEDFNLFTQLVQDGDLSTNAWYHTGYDEEGRGFSCNFLSFMLQDIQMLMFVVEHGDFCLNGILDEVYRVVSEEEGPDCLIPVGYHARYHPLWGDGIEKPISDACLLYILERGGSTHYTAQSWVDVQQVYDAYHDHGGSWSKPRPFLPLIAKLRRAGLLGEILETVVVKCRGQFHFVSLQRDEIEYSITNIGMTCIVAMQACIRRFLVQHRLLRHRLDPDILFEPAFKKRRLALLSLDQTFQKFNDK